MPEEHIDLSIALKKLHQLAYEDGDLGCLYWTSISNLLKRAAGMQEEINALAHELEVCQAKLSQQAARRRGETEFPPLPR